MRPLKTRRHNLEKSVAAQPLLVHASYVARYVEGDDGANAVERRELAKRALEVDGQSVPCEIRYFCKEMRPYQHRYRMS